MVHDTIGNSKKVLLARNEFNFKKRCCMQKKRTQEIQEMA
jgi:hypothetical protein